MSNKKKITIEDKIREDNSYGLRSENRNKNLDRRARFLATIQNI